MRPVILVVEDDPKTLDAYCRLFTLKGCIAIPADSVGVALQAIRRPLLAIDGVLLDLWLGDGSGERFLIESRAGGFVARIVVHSGAANGPAENARLIELGADAVAPKPSLFADIWSAVLPDTPYR
jgi:DNA-binding response OmpR family regulator